MNDTWITIVAGVLIALALLAQLNLLRIFASDWRAGKQGNRATKFSRPRRGRRVRPSTERLRRRIGFLACVAIPAQLTCPALGGQPGAAASLSFGNRYAAWTLNAGISALFLGDHTADYNAGDDQELIGFFGLQVNF